jgi:selenocysteine lyase/cysteine desulfurase
MEEIEARILSLTDYLITGLQAKGCSIETPISDRRERSGIVSFRHPATDSSELNERLQAAGVIVSLRGELIRVSPHFYNTEDELEQLLTVLPQ